MGVGGIRQEVASAEEGSFGRKIRMKVRSGWRNLGEWERKKSGRNERLETWRCTMTPLLARGQVKGARSTVFWTVSIVSRNIYWLRTAPRSCFSASTSPRLSPAKKGFLDQDSSAYGVTRGIYIIREPSATCKTPATRLGMRRESHPIMYTRCCPETCPSWTPRALPPPRTGNYLCIYSTTSHNYFFRSPEFSQKLRNSIATYRKKI